MHRALLSFPLLALVAGCDLSTPFESQVAKRPAGISTERLSFGGLERSYLLVVPKNPKPGPLPVVIALHGVTSNAATMAAITEIQRYADRDGFIGLVPNGSGSLSGWNAGWIDLTGRKADDVGFVRTILDRTEGEFSVDKRRVFVLGHSNGAFLANAVAADLGSRVAAFASVAGSIGLKNGTRIPEPKAPVSALFIHGLADTVVSYDGSVQALISPVSAPDTAAFWAKADGAKSPPTKSDYASGNAVITLYPKGRDGTEVELITTKRGLHDFPGAPTRRGRESLHGIVAMDEILKFFAAHPHR